MPEFSACYFCGTALDASLAEYPVVPKALHPAADDQRTVVLCPSCRRKLGAVVDTVLAAVDESPGDDSVQRDLEESTTDPSTDADEVGISVERLDSSDDEREAEDSGFEFQGDADDADSNDAADSASPDEADADPLADADEAPLEDAPGDDGESTEAESTDATDETAASVGDEAAEDEAPGRPDEDDATETIDDEPQMSALEYNKVMRLLQNREFPVDKEEFKVVATNAYEIGDDEFEAVIEAAAKRDLIGVENGRIVDA